MTGVSGKISFVDPSFPRPVTSHPFMEDLRRIAEENEARIIAALSSGPKGWKELLNETKFARGTLAKHLKRLLERGLITERIDPNDRRRKIYVLNIDGLKALAEVILAVDLAILLMQDEEQILRECQRIENPDERRKHFLNEVRLNVGTLFVTSLAGYPTAEKIALKALDLYATLTDMRIFAPLDEDVKELYNELFAKDVQTIYEDLKNRVKKYVKLLK